MAVKTAAAAVLMLPFQFPSITRTIAAIYFTTRALYMLSSHTKRHSGHRTVQSTVVASIYRNFNGQQHASYYDPKTVLMIFRASAGFEREHMVASGDQDDVEFHNRELLLL